MIVDTQSEDTNYNIQSAKIKLTFCQCNIINNDNYNQ